MTSLRPQGVGSPLPASAWRDLASLQPLDPAIGVQMEQAEYGFAPNASLPDASLFAAAYLRLEPILGPPASVVVCFSWLKRGGAEWVGVQFVREAQRRYGLDRVLVLVVDWDVDEARDWLPSDTRLCVLMRKAPELDRTQRSIFLLHVLAALRPALMMNCNSGVTWDLMRDYGDELSKITRLAAFAFCFDYTGDGQPIGYPESHLPAAIGRLSHVVSDNEGFRGELAKVFAFPPMWLDKVHAVYQPIELPPRPAFGPWPSEGGGRPRVLWASRLARQKRPELARQIALLRPGYDFVVYGDLYDTGYSEADFVTANLRHAGSYRTLRDLPVTSFDAFLYTAAYDGLPNIVLAAGALGLPVVTARVGGIGEVIDDSTGWPVDEHGEAQAYAAVLDAALSNPAARRRRAENLYDRIASKHSDEAYRDRIAGLGVMP